MNPGIFAGSGSGSGSFSAPSVSGFIRKGILANPTGTLGFVAEAAQAKSFTVSTSAGVWKEMISVTGRGCVNWAGITTNTVTNISYEFEVDGAIVQSVGPLSSSGGDGVIIVGAGFYNPNSGDAVATFQPTYFQSSFKVRILTFGAATTAVLINAEIYR